jgi:hypothetical protein
MSVPTFELDNRFDEEARIIREKGKAAAKQLLWWATVKCPHGERFEVCLMKGEATGAGNVYQFRFASQTTIQTAMQIIYAGNSQGGLHAYSECEIPPGVYPFRFRGVPEVDFEGQK